MSELTEKDLEKNLKEYLLSHGYPEKSIISEYKLGKYRADLVIIDTETNTPIQLFELKSSKNSRLINFGKQQLENFMQEARKLNADVIGYLVFPSHHSPYFEAINVESSTAREDKNINFNYEAQVNRSRFAKAEIIKTKKVEAVDELKEKINKLVILMLAILAADILDIVELTNIRFYLIIAMSILYLLPYYEVIKVFNLELIKNHKENSNKDK